MVTFTPDAAQARAVADVARWYRDPNSPQVYRLFGYAGSGKTTLAQHITRELGVPAKYAAYSGKAASVLQRKGCDGASTIHRLIYKPMSKSRQELTALQVEYARQPTPELAAKIEAVQRELARPAFTLNQDSELLTTKLLILDEVSMVTAQMAADLQSFGCKILCLGDPMQLPPIAGEGYYTSARPDTMLTQIHRSALNSPVTRLATIARTSDEDDYGVSGMDGDSGRSVVGVPMGDFDQVLVWKNATRWSVINRMRKTAGYAGLGPQVGERIITLANNPDAEVLNGEQFTVLGIEESAGLYALRVLTDDGYDRGLVVYRDGFSGVDGEAHVKRSGWKGPIAAATYAHALTVHKAQGSQWDRVLVLDESRGVARVSGAETAQRWFYTALTRAAQQVVIRPAPRA